MPYFTGFLGLMPLDQSIIFEAGGRISNHKLPFRDFYFPYGLTPSLMQAVFFKILAMNWAAYVTHAAVINGCFGMMFFDCLRMLLPATKKRNLFAGTLMAAWAFYPMTGTPFLENHSLFFAFAAYWVLLAGLKRKKYYLLNFCFPLMVPGFYSKPIPVVFFLLPIFFECWLNRAYWRSYALPLIFGGVIATIFMFLPFLVFPPAATWYYSFVLPSQLGKTRMGDSFFSRLLHASKYFKLLYISLVPAIIFIAFYWERTVNAWQKFPRALLFTGIAVLTGVLTKNAFYNVTTPICIFSFLLLHFTILEQQDGRRLHFMYSKLHFVLWFLMIAGTSMINFRRTIDIQFGLNDLRNYSTQLGLFVKTPLNRYSKEDIEKLQKYIRGNASLYTGDLQFLFSLSQRYNPLPLTHINDHTTYNSSDSIAYSRLKKQLLENMIREKTSLVIFDESIYNPRQDLVNYLGNLKGAPVDSFAGINVYLVNEKALHQLASSLNIIREK